jgi:hypothetical protein
MSLITRFFKTTSQKKVRANRPLLEELESRVVLYSASGNLWPAPQLVTISIMPDGTNLGGPTSNLNSVFNSKPVLNQPGNGWQSIILRAAQAWAAQTNLNFSLVTDNGAPLGAAGNQQGDPNFGDIRIGGFNFGTSTLARAFQPPPVNNFSIAGDISFNTGQFFSVNSTYDLFTVATHEIGHALGLDHSASYTAEMYPTYNGVKQNLNSDDISGIRSIYGGARTPDQYEGSSGNGSSGNAYDITSLIDTSALTALVTNADITSTSELDYYALTVPSGTNGTMTVTMQSQGLSLLEPKLTIYDSTMTSVGSVSGTQFGDTITVSVSGVSAGQTYYLKASSPLSTANGTGAYALSMTFGTNATPTVPLPNTQTPSGYPLHSGGGIADQSKPHAPVAVKRHHPLPTHKAVPHLAVKYHPLKGVACQWSPAAFDVRPHRPRQEAS